METVYAPMYPDELELLIIAFTQIWVRVEQKKVGEKGYSKQGTWPAEQKKANATWMLKVTYLFMFQSFLPAAPTPSALILHQSVAFKFNLKFQVS